MEDFIHLTTPAGPIAVSKQSIVVIATTDSNKQDVSTNVYLIGDPEPFNIIEDFETVCDLLGC